MNKKYHIIYKLRFWFWRTRLGEWLGEKLSERCENCPLCSLDYADYHDTGYIGAYCSLHKQNEAEGCFTPRQIISVIAKRRKKAELAEIEAEKQMYEAGRANE